MKNIAIIRHGENSDYDANINDFPLSPLGCAQISKLIPILQSENIESAIVLTSPLLRAKQSASMIADHFEFTLEWYDILEQQSHPTEKHFEQIYDLIMDRAKEYEVETAIVVTHGEYTGDLLNYITDKLNQKKWFPGAGGHGIPKGAMLFFKTEDQHVDFWYAYDSNSELEKYVF